MRRLVIGLVFAAALGAAGLAQQAAPARADAAISGIVIDGVTKQPVADALVQLRWPQQRQFPQVQLRKFTDGKGRFVFSGLPPSDAYSVIAERSGYFDGAFGFDRRHFEAGANIELKDGEWFGTATITLWPPSSISGTVTDERGEPVVSVFVQLLAEVRRAGTVHLATSEFTTTDDRGMYRIGMLQPGKYYVLVPSVSASAPSAADAPALRGMPAAEAAALRASGRPLGSYDPPLVDAGASVKLAMLGYPVPPPPSDGRPNAYPMTFSGGTSLAQASAVVVDAGTDRSGVDVRIVPVPAGRITGVIEGSPDARANCLLRLMPAGLEDLGLASTAATTLSGADGSFTFVNVPAGNYTIDVPMTVNQYAVGDFSFPSPRPAVPPGLPDDNTLLNYLPGSPGFGFVSGDTVLRNTWARVPVSVSPREDTRVVVPLHPAITLAGRFVTDSAATSPLPSFASSYITLETVSGSVWHGRRSASGQAPAGEFVVNGLLPGAYHLRSSSLRWRLKSVAIAAADYTHKPIDLAGGVSHSDVVVTFTNATTTISGPVSTDSAGPAQTAAVIAFPVEREQWVNYGIFPVRIASVRTSSTGQFQLTTLPAGAYYLIAVPVAKADAWTAPDFFQRAQPVATRVEVAWGDTKSVSLRVIDLR